MIFDTTNNDRLAPNVLQNARHVSMQSSAKFDISEKRNTVLRAEDNMQNETGE